MSHRSSKTQAGKLSFGELALIKGVHYKRIEPQTVAGIAFMSVDLSDPWREGEVKFFPRDKQVEKVEVAYRPSYGKRRVIELAAA